MQWERRDRIGIKCIFIRIYVERGILPAPPERDDLFLALCITDGAMVGKVRFWSNP
ncbi:hypothetical protein THICB3330018 [Thiomonas sp. CB3]|nr:hypothetical protein THICB3330018 [Thiomonas sp. CB3]